MNRRGTSAARGLWQRLTALWGGGEAQPEGSDSRPVPPDSQGREAAPGAAVDPLTVERDPRAVDLQIVYAPKPDGMPDGGEVVWTWVPYVENDGRGKDRPVLIIAREDTDRVFAVKLTSRSHDGDRDFLPLGPGPWDAAGRPSWVDVDQLYSVHTRGIRREASALDADRFALVARALQARFGWSIAP